MTLDRYLHVVTEPDGDEWRPFWLDACDSKRRRKRAEALPGEVSVWSREAEQS